MGASILRAVECATVNGRLLYVVGPSGSGKDSLIDYARPRAPANVAFARRTITRLASAGGEQHIAVTPHDFEELLASGAFAMHWRANGLSYGIGREIVDWLAQGRTVVVSGSRAYLPQALAAFPHLQVVSITASAETLRARLVARSRESAAEIEARLARATALHVPPGTPVREIRNDGGLAQGGEKLLRLLD